MNKPKIEGYSDYKSTVAYKKLQSLLNENFIEESNFFELEKRISNVFFNLFKYQKYEKKITTDLIEIKEKTKEAEEDNYKLQNRLNEINDCISRQNEEIRKTKDELTEHETNRINSKKLEVAY